MILNNSSRKPVQDREIGFHEWYFPAVAVNLVCRKLFYCASVNLSEIPALVLDVGICCETCGLLMV